MAEQFIQHSRMLTIGTRSGEDKQIFKNNLIFSIPRFI